MLTCGTQPEEDATIWHVPLELKTVQHDSVQIDHKVVLDKREAFIPLKDVKNTFYKLNAETTGFCPSLPSPMILLLTCKVMMQTA